MEMTPFCAKGGEPGRTPAEEVLHIVEEYKQTRLRGRGVFNIASACSTTLVRWTQPPTLPLTANTKPDRFCPSNRVGHVAVGRQVHTTATEL